MIKIKGVMGPSAHRHQSDAKTDQICIPEILQMTDVSIFLN